MKGSFLFAALIVLAAGCSIIEDDFIQGSRRQARPGGGSNTRPGTQERDSTESGARADPSKPDTVIYCSAVRCTDDYDWQRDTACNSASYEVLLYKNGKEILSIPAGKGRCISPAPDLQHIIDGHLYTEYCTLEETVICRDGEQILRFNGNEILKGLVYKDGHVHTLSRKRDGTGFTYRKDGEILLAQGGIKVFGGFDNPSYPASGALYLDGNDIVFCYKDISSANTCHAVINGKAKDLNFTSTRILDVKICKGEAAKATNTEMMVIWTEANVITNSAYVLTGISSGWTCAVTKDRNRYERLSKGETAVYCSANRAAIALRTEDGEISVHYSPGKEHLAYEGAWHLFTTDCCAMVGDELLVGLSPKERGGRARLCLGAKTYELEGLGNGFITGVAGTISLPK